MRKNTKFKDSMFFCEILIVYVKFSESKILNLSPYAAPREKEHKKCFFCKSILNGIYKTLFNV